MKRGKILSGENKFTQFITIALKDGVKIIAHKQNNDEILLAQFEVLGKKNEGIGTKYLEEFTKQVRKLGYRKIRLYAYPKGFMLGKAPWINLNALVKFYIKNGFIQLEPIRPNCGGIEMVKYVKPFKCKNFTGNLFLCKELRFTCNDRRSNCEIYRD